MLDFAMVHGAIYDAVNSIDRRYQSYLHVPRASRTASKDAAAATAGFRVLAANFPGQLMTLKGYYATSLAAIRDGKAKERGIAAGEAAAAAMLDARENDGRLAPGTPYPFPQGTAPGEWRVSPPLTAVDPAWWVGNVKPFLIPNARWFLSEGPNALTSRAYARDFEEVKRLGELHSPDRTEDQTMAAIFWQAQPLGLYSGVMRDLSLRYRLEHGRERAVVRDGDAGGGRLGDRVLEGQVHAQVLAADRRRSAWPTATATARPRRTRTGGRCLTPPRRPRRRWRRRTSPTTRPATAA